MRKSDRMGFFGNQVFINDGSEVSHTFIENN